MTSGPARRLPASIAEGKPAYGAHVAVPVTADRRARLRATFDLAAHLYQDARPDYPDELYADLVALLAQDARLLEIGCATGKATVPLARRGYAIKCVELGADLAAEARTNLAPWPRVEVVNANFEHWDPEPGAYDLAYAATAWGWIDPVIGWSKLWLALKPRAAFAMIEAHHVAHDDAELDRFWVETQKIYERWMPSEDEFEPHLRHPDSIPDPVWPPEAAGLFERDVVRRYLFEVDHDATSYANLMRTFSNHIALGPEKLDGICRDVAEFIDTRFGGHINKQHLGMLRIARRV